MFVSRRIFFLLLAISPLFLGIGLGASHLAAQDDDLFGAPPVPAAPAIAPNPGGNAPADLDLSPSATPSASPTPPPRRADNYLVWMMRSLGWFFSPVFILLSLTMVALVVMNIFAIRRSSLVPENFVQQFGAYLDEKKNQEAWQIANEDESLLGKVLAAGLGHLNTDGYDKATQAMQDVAQAETMRLEHQLGYLALIGNLAPMIGLFGTVVGMIEAFQVIAAGGAAPSPQKLAEGIATAMFTTMVGLAIALPSLAIFDIFKNRLAKFTMEIGMISDGFMSRFDPKAPNKR